MIDWLMYFIKETNIKKKYYLLLKKFSIYKIKNCEFVLKVFRLFFIKKHAWDKCYITIKIVTTKLQMWLPDEAIFNYINVLSVIIYYVGKFFIFIFKIKLVLTLAKKMVYNWFISYSPLM